MLLLFKMCLASAYIIAKEIRIISSDCQLHSNYTHDVILYLRYVSLRNCLTGRRTFADKPKTWLLNSPCQQLHSNYSNMWKFYWHWETSMTWEWYRFRSRKNSVSYFSSLCNWYLMSACLLIVTSRPVRPLTHFILISLSLWNPSSQETSWRPSIFHCTISRWLWKT